MSTDKTETPKFTNPPIYETVIGVQFRSLPIRIVHYGLLWEKLRRDGFSKSEEHPGLEHVLEQQDQQTKVWTWTLSLTDNPPDNPRVWFLRDDSADGQQLIQVQSDRFLVNWRRRSIADARYPSYKVNRNEFEKRFSEFINFSSGEKLGEVVADQCEIIYVNQIPVESDCATPEEMFGRSFPLWNSEALKFPTFKYAQASVALSFWIEQLPGRLYIDAQSVTLRESGKKSIDLRLTARGAPIKPDVEGVMNWLDTGHHLIVTAFTDITSSYMHEKWGRTK